jgi:hypothetical protein
VGAFGLVDLVGLVGLDPTNLTDLFLALRPWSSGCACPCFGILADIPSPGNLSLAYNNHIIFIKYMNKYYIPKPLLAVQACPTLANNKICQTEMQ